MVSIAVTVPSMFKWVKKLNIVLEKAMKAQGL